MVWVLWILYEHHSCLTYYTLSRSEPGLCFCFYMDVLPRFKVIKDGILPLNQILTAALLILYTQNLWIILDSFFFNCHILSVTYSSKHHHYHCIQNKLSPKYHACFKFHTFDLPSYLSKIHFEAIFSIQQITIILLLFPRALERKVTNNIQYTLLSK